MAVRICSKGCLFSIPLLVILLAHEFGHYVACKRWQVDATLPFFLPSPFLLGTFGAFIRIKSPIYTRRSLFDIGVSGPLAGFLILAADSGGRNCVVASGSKPCPPAAT